MVGKNGTVARYGGEEFAIFLPDMGKQHALELAETIRLTVANRPFSCMEI
ncbi:diguanylate cyclase domain-containing protein [Mesobacillus harenae]|nr:diguanylate cyclase [Mesobacillus harenae]